MMRNLDLKNPDNTALYRVVERYICNAIAEGKLSPGERLQPPDELAKLWGLSTGTLRQALQILAARGVVVRRPKLGTFVNPDFNPSRDINDQVTSPRVRATGGRERTKCIAMVVPDVINADYATVMRGVESAAEAADYNIMVGNSEDDPARLNQVVRQQIKERVGGLIILSGKQQALEFDVIKSIQEQQIPVVACYRPLGLVDWPVVRTDGLYNTHLIAQHLCKTGRKHIALYDFATESDVELSFKRDGQLGFLSALNESGIILDPDLHLEFPLSTTPKGRAYYVIRKEEVDQAAQWFKSRPKVDAVLCVLPRLAAIVVQALKKLGRRIPDDVAVAAMGEDGHLFGLGVDWLTSLTDKWSDVGSRACELVLAIRGGQMVPPNTTITLKGVLSIGESTVRS